METFNKPDSVGGDITLSTDYFLGNVPSVVFRLRSFLEFGYVRTASRPYSTAEEWPWLGEMLMSTAHVRPSIMLPEIIMLLNKASGDPAMQRHIYDLERLRFWFKDRQRDILEQIIGGFEIPDQMPEDSRYTIKVGVEQAKLLLESDLSA